MILVFALLMSTGAHAQSLSVTNGQIVSIPDGDTLCIQTDANEFKKVRLHGIDAPENDQEDGEWAGAILREFALNTKVKVVSGPLDPYGRLLGTAEVNSSVTDECSNNKNGATELNEYMLCKGAAWYYKRFENTYSAEEKTRWINAYNKANAASIGIWKQDKSALTPPWNWRKDHQPSPVPCP